MGDSFEFDVTSRLKNIIVRHVLKRARFVSQSADVGSECSPLEVKTAYDLISCSFIL